MRRMYGEVRQLSLLRMEFSGDSNTIEESRDFDELFKPITTFGPSPSTLSSYLTTETIPTLVVTSGSEESIVKTSSPSSNIPASEDVPIVSEPEEDFVPTTVEGTTTEEIGSGSDKDILNDSNNNNNGNLIGVTEEPLPETTLTPLGSSAEEPILLAPAPLSPNQREDDEKTRTEGQVLFQDFEKESESSSSSSSSSSAPTTEQVESRIRSPPKVGV